MRTHRSLVCTCDTQYQLFLDRKMTSTFQQPWCRVGREHVWSLLLSRCHGQLHRYGHCESWHSNPDMKFAQETTNRRSWICRMLCGHHWTCSNRIVCRCPAEAQKTSRGTIQTCLQCEACTCHMHPMSVFQERGKLIMFQRILPVRELFHVAHIDSRVEMRISMSRILHQVHEVSERFFCGCKMSLPWNTQVSVDSCHDRPVV